MTFQQLSYLVEVAKTGSINKTSRQLFVSQSCISSSLQQLENELNVKLLTRNSRGVELTAEGKELVQYAASILEQKNILQSLCASSPSTISTSFSVSSQRYPFVESAFLKLLQESEASFYKYTINECPMDTIIDEVRDSRSNLGVIFINSTTRRVLESILKKNELQFETLAEITPGIYLSKKHPLLRESSITMEDLCRYPFLSYKQNDGVAMDFSEEFQVPAYSSIPQRILVSDRSSAIRILSETLAFSTGSGLLDPALDEGIVTLPLESSQTIRIGWIHPKNSAIGTVGERFVSLLKVELNRYMQVTCRMQATLPSVCAGRQSMVS